MTKKDYELIAEVFKTSKPLNFDEQAQFEYMLEKMIDALELENSRFDREKFLDYIGLYELNVK